MAASGSSSLRATASRERHNHIPPSSHSSSRNLNNGPIHNHSVRTCKERPSSASSSTSSSSSSFRRSVTPNHRIHPSNNDEDPGRVRVAVRLRPRNAEDLLSDTDFADCVELQPELKRLKLRKNNWSSESYRFDEVFTETASQRRVYEVVAKPVVESVLNGYNGTVMAYGQTGTGKTYTLGRLGKDDASERGIMVRALEDIISSMSVTSDSVEVSYLQLYMESIQDLLAPEKVNIPINEDPKAGEVSLPGATVVKLRDLDHLLQLLQVGEVNRHAANTKLNTESSRSHAILVVYIRRSVHEIIDKITSEEKDTRTELPGDNHVPLVRKSKLLIVDLAGSERIDKSGSEGPLLEEAKFINLSLSSLGKCINALAENSPHIPTRDSKLTRLLRDSFGGSARTSLIITVGPSGRNHAETTSTIMFGQRAMKVVNMVKLKEEFDYESLCRKLETQVDHLTAEIERKQKLRENDKCELEKLLRECQISYDEAKDNLVTQVELLTAKIEMQQKLRENDKYEFEKQLRESQISYDESMRNLVTRSEFLEKENARLELEVEKILGELNHQKDQNNLKREKIVQLEISLKNSKQQQLDNSSYQKVLADTTQMYEKKITELIKQLEIEHARSEGAEEQVDIMKKLISENQKSIEQYEMENSTYQKALADTTQLYEKKIAELNKKLEDEHACFEGAVEQLDMGQKEVHELCVKLKETRQLHESAVYEVQTLKSEYKNLLEEKETMSDELQAARQRLLVEEKQRKAIEYELVKLKKTAPEHDDDFEDKKPYTKDYISKGSSRFGAPMSLQKSNPSRELSVGLPKILQLLTSEDPDVQIHAVKVVANLAAEDINQEKIVEEGGLDALLLLLRTSQNTTILRVASGAIANLAMNEMNQGLIMSRGGGQLLAKTASKTDDPQTLRMVAGALANLCGNEKLHTMLEEDGAIKALLAMVRSGNIDVIAQVARGLANFAKCESRAIVQGQRKGRSHLMEDSALEWLIANSKTNSASTRRHVELALCHLAQNEDNARDFISRGGAKELVQISIESSREDIRNLAKKTMKSNPRLQADTHA
ncbi:kinesin-like protein KIN-UC [Citrus sinensis]|uniref:Kinesin-like protein KIN-UC n=1 Tax=Citrus sinensis TaxID=2711 RepID=A0ACB8L512_CITSI|nr:kinesin-like protein KIN-UC [Citrus sinensis]